MSDTRSFEELGYVRVRVYTSARTVKPIVGKINGRKIPYGPFHVAQIIAFIVPVVIAVIVAKLFDVSMIAAFGVSGTLGVIAAMALAPMSRRDGVPLPHQLARMTRLILVRRPHVIGDPDEIKRMRTEIRSALKAPATDIDEDPNGDFNADDDETETEPAERQAPTNLTKQRP